jgi:hypothetical protein
MNWNRKVYLPAASLSLAAARLLSADEFPASACPPPTPPAPCYSVEEPCCCTQCLGPENVAGNPAVRPKTCNGDFVLTVAGFYWTAHQDGLEYAVETNSSPANNGSVNIFNGDFKKPHSHWRPGFKLGVGYNSSCDGWDVNLLWTHLKARASSDVDADEGTNAIIPLFSAFADPTGGQLNATFAKGKWSLKFDVVDLELGREFWVSKYLTLRPNIGLRFARLDQDYDVFYSGGSFGTLHDQNDLDNNFKGIGPRAGLDTVWHLRCGFSLFGNAAFSILYGRFHVREDEQTSLAVSPFTSTTLLSAKERFHTSKGALDLILGVQYETMFCDCRYGFVIGLAWENHLFFNQNHLWRINRVAQTATPGTGENVFFKTSGDLSTQGVTLNLRFEF